VLELLCACIPADLCTAAAAAYTVCLLCLCAAKLGQSKESLRLLKAFNVVQAILTATVRHAAALRRMFGWCLFEGAGLVIHSQ
jgi:hypothetical protein